MSVLGRLLGGQTTTAGPPPHDDFWYTLLPDGTGAAPMSAETATKISTVWRCIEIIAGSVAMLPLVIYRRRADGGRDADRRHPLYAVLHDQPNGWQTAFEFRHMLTTHVLLRGNGYAELKAGPRGFADQLWPLHPDRVQVDQQDDGSLVYTVTRQNGRRDRLGEERVFHLRGLSDDGVSGVAILDRAAMTLGIARKQERFASRFFDQSPQPGGAIEVAGELSDQAYERLKQNWIAHYAGANAHKPALLEGGAKWTPFQVGLTAEQAQLVASREFTKQDVATWFGVPPHMVGETTKETSWGSGIEQMSIGFVIYTLMHWLRRWEQAIARDLILATDTYFAEHNVEGLLRGDTKTRYEAYERALGGPTRWMTPNEVRRRENLNPIPGLDEAPPTGSTAPERTGGGTEDEDDEPDVDS